MQLMECERVKQRYDVHACTTTSSIALLLLLLLLLLLSLLLLSLLLLSLMLLLWLLLLVLEWSENMVQVAVRKTVRVASQELLPQLPQGLELPGIGGLLFRTSFVQAPLCVDSRRMQPSRLPLVVVVVVVVCWSVGWFVGRSVGWFVGWLVGWLGA